MTFKSIIFYILIIVLLLFIIYSFYTNIHEGLGTSMSVEDMAIVQQYLDTYNKTTEEGSCTTGVKTIKALNIPNINKIIKENADLSNCIIIEKIAGINNTNEKVLQAINVCYGQKYTAVLNMMKDIKSTNVYTNDSNFSSFINSTIKYPSVNGNNSSVDVIQSYMSAMDSVNQMDKLQNPTSSPPPT